MTDSEHKDVSLRYLGSGFCNGNPNTEQSDSNPLLLKKHDPPAGLVGPVVGFGLTEPAGWVIVEKLVGITGVGVRVGVDEGILVAVGVLVGVLVLVGGGEKLLNLIEGGSVDAIALAGI